MLDLDVDEVSFESCLLTDFCDLDDDEVDEVDLLEDAFSILGFEDFNFIVFSLSDFIGFGTGRVVEGSSLVEDVLAFFSGGIL